MDTDEDERDTLETFALLTRESVNLFSLERIAMRLTAYEWIIRAHPMGIPGRFTDESLANLLRRIPAGLRKWTWEKTRRTILLTYAWMGK